SCVPPVRPPGTTQRRAPAVRRAPRHAARIRGASGARLPQRHLAARKAARSAAHAADESTVTLAFASRLAAPISRRGQQPRQLQLPSKSVCCSANPVVTLRNEASEHRFISVNLDSSRDLREQMRQAARETVHAAILDAAEELIAEHGLHSAALVQIAKRAGVAV